MAKVTDDFILEGPLQRLVDNCDLMTLCEGQPASYADAFNQKGSGGVRVASVAMAGADFGAFADGNVSGRKVETVQKTNGTPEQIGNGYYIALLDTVNSRLLHTAPAGVNVSGTAQAGGSTTSLVLDAGDGSADGDYIGQALRITGGTGAGTEDVVITTHAGGSIGFADIGVTPDATSTYEIYGANIPAVVGNVTFNPTRVEFFDVNQ